MLIEMMKCKIHRATVTDANKDYVGSVTIDRDLMDAAGLLENEKVHVLNITNGARLVTYVIEGERGSGVICLNGAAAHHALAGDLVIIIAYCVVDAAKGEEHTPKVIFVNEKNRQTAAI